MGNKKLSHAYLRFAEHLFERANHARLSGESLFGALARLGIIDEQVLARELADCAGIELADESFESATIEPEALNFLSGRLARRLHAIPISCREGKILTVAVSDPLDQSVRDTLALATGCSIVLVVAPEQVINIKIAECYPKKETGEDELPEGSIPKEVKSWLLLMLRKHRQLSVSPWGVFYSVDLGRPTSELARLTPFDGKLVLARLKIMAGLDAGDVGKKQKGLIDLKLGRKQRVVLSLEISPVHMEESAVVSFVS